jgi:hypothetical protein
MIEVESGVTVHIEGVQMECGGENVSSASMSLRNLKAGKATGGWDIVWCGKEVEGGKGRFIQVCCSCWRGGAESTR